MTVCVAALSSDGIVCVADRALTFGDYTQWDSDCIKIINIRGEAISMNSSQTEVDYTRVMQGLSEIKNYSVPRYEMIELLRRKFLECLMIRRHLKFLHRS